MRVSKSLVPRLVVVISAVCLSVVGQTIPGKGALTIEKLMQIKHPSSPLWSPDGRHIAFIWDQGGVYNFFLASTDGAAPVALTSYKEGQVSGAFWGSDGKVLYFPRDGNLWQTEIPGGSPKPVWNTPERESGFVLSPDGTRMAFVRPGPNQSADLWVRSLQGAQEVRIAHNDLSIAQVSWSPDGQHLAYAGGQRTIIHDEAPAYSGAKIIYTITERTPGQLYVVGATGGDPVAIGTPGGYGGVRWIDARHVSFDRQSSDYKKRTIYAAEIASGKVTVAHEDIDDKFWSIPGDAGSAGQPSPDGRWIAFLSDRDGWDHLYVMPSSGGEPLQITKGHFEAWRPQWSHDSKRIAFDANSEEHPGDRHLFIATIGDDPAHATIQAVTSGQGTETSPTWSPDDKSLVYQHTDAHNSADLFEVKAQAGARPARLTDSMPDDIDRSALVAPQFVHYPGADGQQVPGWLFLPKNFDRTKKHPAIVWIHGDGINQNYDGWHIQRNYAVYYSFHQYLLQQGYVIFAPDYRGSIGYGRAWRQGVYMDIGDKDAKDAWMSANYLKSLGYVDPDRIGVWGLSYGGFFTLIALTDQPTLFRAGVDVGGVVDYRMYYSDPYHGGWTASRIGTPEQNPEVYDKASPLSHIDQLQRPLLILHGTADVNVPYLESVRLIDEALKQHKGNLLQFMMYPGEFHYFDREHVLNDAWHRVDRFFHSHLQAGEPVSH